jgi:Flp pilus assembly protein TadB
MNWVLLILSFLVSIFIFFCFFNSGHIKTKSLVKRIENYTSNIINKKEISRRLNKIHLFLEERGSTKIFGVNIKSLEGLFIFRVMLSLSSAIILLAFGFFINKNFLILSLLISLVLFFLPLEILNSRVKNIGKRVLNEIPDFLDIISSLIRAGLNLDLAINYYSNNYKGEISQLLKILRAKIYGGKDRKTSYLEIARLSFSNEFNSIIKIIIQSDLIGNPVNTVLKGLSKTIRENQRDQIKIKAEKLESSMILIIFIFMFIPMMVLFLLPVVPQLKIIFD